MNDLAISDRRSPPEPGRFDLVGGTARRHAPIVIILGMHRSGTSLCSQVLGALGVDMVDGGADVLPAPGNSRGHWERRAIVELHDRMLETFNRGYDTSCHDFPLPPSWWADPTVQSVKREIIAYLRERSTGGPFGFKDPRTARVLPIWHQIWRELHLAPQIVLCLRNPAQVAQSLHARDGLPHDIGEYRWFLYMAEIFQQLRGLDYCIIEYEDWFQDHTVNSKKLTEFLKLEAGLREQDLYALVEEAVDYSLRHYDPAHGETRQPFIRSFYRLVRASGQDPGVRKELEAIAHTFASYQQLERPFQREFERIAADAAQLPDLQSSAREAAERAELADAELREKQHEIDRLAQSLDQLRQQLATESSSAEALRLDLEARQASLAEAEDARIRLQFAVAATEARLTTALDKADQEAREREAATEALRHELGAAQERAAEHDHKAQEQEAAAETLRRDLGEIRERLAQTEHEAREQADAAEALRHEIGEARERVTELDQTVRAQEVAAEALCRELRDAQDRLTQAERETHEHTDAAEALRRELGNAQERLAQTEREAREQADAAEALRHEIGEARERATELDQQARAQEVAAETLRRELRDAQDRLTQAERETQEHTDAAEALRHELGNAQERLAQVEHEARQQADAAEALRHELGEAQERVTEHDQKALEQQAAAETLRRELDEAQERLAQAEHEAREQADAAEVLRRQLGEAQERVTEHDQKVREQQAAAETLRRELDEALERLTHAEHEAREQEADAEGLRCALAAARIELLGEKEAAEAASAVNEASLAQAKRQVAAREEAEHTIRLEFEAVQAELAGRDQALSWVMAEIEEKRAEIERLRSEAEEHIGAIAVVMSESRGQAGSIEAARAEIAELRRELTESHREAAAQTRASREEIEALAAELQGRDQAMLWALQEIERKNAQIGQLHEEINAGAEMKATMDALRDEVAAARKVGQAMGLALASVSNSVGPTRSTRARGFSFGFFWRRRRSARDGLQPR